jgi:peptidoglycan/LPS O-acetylase OafA/YrhL
MGYYRFLLAICVLESHTALFAWGFDEGQAAVIGFFLVSGYVMTLLIDKYYLSFRSLPWFVIDRVSRIFPQFLLYATLTVILISTVHLNESWESACTPGIIARNYAILPLYFSGNIPYYKCTLLPQSWTLSVELFFYMIVPFIVIFWNRYIALVVAAYSLWVYGHAYLGLIPTDWNGFRHLPGTLYIFIAGMSFAKAGRVWQIYRWSVWIGAIILMAILLRDPVLYAYGSNKEILLGLIVGIPGLALARMVPPHWLEQLAGNLSYGIFLNHFLLMMTMHVFHINTGLTKWRILTVFIAAGFALVSFYSVENPILIWRRSFRGRRVRQGGMQDPELASETVAP